MIRDKEFFEGVDCAIYETGGKEVIVTLDMAKVPVDSREEIDRVASGLINQVNNILGVKQADCNRRLKCQE